MIAVVKVFRSRQSSFQPDYENARKEGKKGKEGKEGRKEEGRKGEREGGRVGGRKMC